MEKQTIRATTSRRRAVQVDEQLNAPKSLRPVLSRRSNDRFGRFTEGVARAMGTPWFLIILTIIVVSWMTFTPRCTQRGIFASSISTP